MSDYLSRVVDRGSSAPAGVRPALPSLFDSEKTSPTLIPAFRSPETERHSTIERSRNIGGETDNDISSVHERLVSIRALLTEAPKTAVAQKSEIIEKQTSAGFVRAPVVPPELRPLSAELRSGAEKPAESSQKQSVARPRAVLSESVVEPVAELLAKRSTGARLPQARTERAKSDSQPRITVTPVSRRRAASSTLTNARDSVVADDDSSSTRSIHVTIGRVEVRAVHLPSESAPPPPARPAPKMSLDDYLRSRNGGAP
jgi:hypothetical protein